jgi:hypothetical protein
MKHVTSPRHSRELPEPHEGSGSLPTLFLLFFAGTAAFSAMYLVKHRGEDLGFAGDQRSPQRLVPTEMTPELAFQKNCASCHQANGRGVEGTFPPLAGSPWVVADGETPIRVVLMGLTGPITVNGATYRGTMPGFRAALSDRDIALAVTHARKSFGNQAAEVTAEDVAKVRATLEGRSAPWAGGAALEEARATKVLP